MQALFFSELYPSETRKLIQRLINYVIYKVIGFLFLRFMKCHPANLFWLFLDSEA